MKSVRNLVAALCVLVAGHAIADQEPAIRLPDAVIDLEFVGNAGGMNRDEIRNWIGASADAVRNYYGQFPVRKLRIRVEATEGRGAQSGTTFSYNGALIRVGVGRYSDVADLKRDWVMTHEMVHLAMPEFSDDHAWLEEGLATYVEPVARAQIGQLTPAQIWHDMVRDMPKGLPAAGDRGLDNTHTWGRTYWGGALFYLIADLRIRERTGNRFGLQDGLRAIVAQGGSVEVAWDVRRTLAIADKATGANVLVELYDEMRNAPVAPDLPALWKRLGVKFTPDGAEFDDNAPLAGIRRAITMPPAG
jgi:hypothetical protein